MALHTLHLVMKGQGGNFTVALGRAVLASTFGLGKLKCARRTVHVLQELNMELPDLLAHPTFLGASLMQVG